ncbi:MAG: hypothetical protein ACE5J5_00905 [Candidatus Hydrothermarchaeales archaeon]
MSEIGITYFYPMLYLALAIFAIGLYTNLSVWAKGKNSGAEIPGVQSEDILNAIIKD